MANSRLTPEYFSSGAGASALLAFAGSMGACDTLVKVLAEAAPGLRVVAPAYPPVSNIGQMLDQVESILAKERLTAEVVYGGSFGGMFAQSWMRRHPGEVKRLILSGCGAPDPERATKNKKWLRRLPYFPMSLMRLALRFALRKLVRDTSRDAQSWRRDYLELISSMGSRDLESRYRVSIDFDENCRFAPADTAGWAGKILVLEGGADRVATLKSRDSLRALYPQAQVHRIEEAGHSLLMSHTDQVVSVMRRFIQEP